MVNAPFYLLDYKIIRTFNISQATYNSMAGHIWLAALEFDTWARTCLHKWTDGDVDEKNVPLPTKSSTSLWFLIYIYRYMGKFLLEKLGTPLFVLWTKNNLTTVLSERSFGWRTELKLAAAKTIWLFESKMPTQTVLLFLVHGCPKVSSKF